MQLAGAAEAEAEGAGSAWFWFPMMLAEAEGAAEEALAEEAAGAAALEEGLCGLEGVTTAPQSPVVPAPGWGVVPEAYAPPYRTFLPGLGKTTSVPSTVLHPGAASTLATKGAG